MNMRHRTGASRAALVAAITSGFLVGRLSTAEARRGAGLGVGLGIAAGAGAIIMQGIKEGASAATERPQRRSAPSRKGKDQDDDEDKSEGRKSARPSTPPAAPATRMTAQERYEQEERARTSRDDWQRNIDGHVANFITELRVRHVVRHMDQKAHETTTKSASEVTEADVRRTLEEAFDLEKLGQFAKFEGEPWPKERLQVRILMEAGKEVVPYFRGVGSRGPNAGDVTQIMQKAARKVYTQVFELSEALGMVMSHERLYRDIAEGGATEKSDMYIEALAGPSFDRAVADYLAINLRGRSDNSLYAYKLRARRAVYDCVAHVATALASPGQAQDPAPSRPERRADVQDAPVIRTGTGQPGVTIVEEPALPPASRDRVLSGDLKGLIAASCKERIAKLNDTTLMPIPAKAVLDDHTRPVVDGQVWLISTEPGPRR